MAKNATIAKVSSNKLKRAKLAEKRAKVILNYLTDLGIKRERLVGVSYGKERPFCNDRSDACYQQNRRGHLVVRP